MIRKRIDARATFASRLAAIRTSRQLPAITLAAMAGLRAGTPGYIERTHANVQLRTIASLCRALQVAPVSFFSESEVLLDGSLTDDEMLQRFSDAVRTVRLAAGISQNGLTTSAGLHRDYIWVLEKRGTNASLDAVEKIAMSLDVSVADLFSSVS
jgi:transcriptional regulator with XRE-family HTH domain